MKILVVFSSRTLSEKEQKDISMQLGWALEKKIIEDIVFMPEGREDRLDIINLHSELSGDELARIEDFLDSKEVSIEGRPNANIA